MCEPCLVLNVISKSQKHKYMLSHRSTKAVKFTETESELNGNCQGLGGGAEKGVV